MKINTIEEAYAIELDVFFKIFEGTEFNEGVRSLLLEKNYKPNWKYKSIKDINEKELIQEFYGNYYIDTDIYAKPPQSLETKESPNIVEKKNFTAHF